MIPHRSIPLLVGLILLLASATAAHTLQVELNPIEGMQPVVLGGPIERVLSLRVTASGEALEYYYYCQNDYPGTPTSTPPVPSRTITGKTSTSTGSSNPTELRPISTGTPAPVPSPSTTR